MPHSTSSSLESSIRLVFGFLLWGVSATLTFVLLVSLGDGTIFSKALLGVVAIALEGAKILTWRKGGAHRVYALGLIVLSGIASLGTSLEVVEKSSSSLLSVSLDAIRASPAYKAREADLASIDAEVAALVDRIRSLPPDYTTAAAKIELNLSSLRNRRETLIASLAKDEGSVGASHGDGSMIVLLGRTLGIRSDLLLLALLLFVSAFIEAGALVLTAPAHDPQSVSEVSRLPCPQPTAAASTPMADPTLPQPSYTPPIAPETFLAAAMEGADLPFLHGRDKTAERLGVTYADAKRLIGKLIEDGRIVVEGKRLRLAKVERTGISEK
jgi:hypothetical protein